MNRNKILIPILVFTAVIVIFIIILNKSSEYNKISISQSKWNEIISNRSENKNLKLEDIEFNDYNIIIDESNDTLYYSVVNESQSKYNPKVKFKATNDNVKIAVLSDEITDEKVRSDYQFYLMIYNETEYHIYNLVCTDLPILSINYKDDAKNKQKNIPVKVYLFNNLSNNPNRIIISDGKLKINEDNYVFSLNMMTPGRNVRENKRALLDMKPNSEYILNPEDVEQDEMNAKDEKRENRIELFINNEYKGIYYISHGMKGK